MNKASRLFYILILVVSLVPNFAIGQDSRVATQAVSLQVAGSALLAVSGPAVVLILAGAREAGEEVVSQTESSDTRLRISSLVNGQETRSISARISEALVGTQLSVELLEPNSNFIYPENQGTLKGLQLLSNESDATLVEGIGTCWSGKEEGDGYVIKYNYKAIPKAPILKSADITVTYTISLVASDSEV